MTVVKDKSCIKYFALAGIILLCIYSNVIADLLVPLFDDIYYGNLVKMFVAITSAIIWGIEVAAIIFVCRRLNIKLFSNSKKELQTWQVILLFVLTIMPMLIISACINWKVKIVYTLGVRVTAISMVCNACEMLAYAVRIILMIMFIASIQQGFEIIFKTKYIIPYGAILAFLTFGLIDFFALSVDLRIFYLVASVLYGIIYLIAGRKLRTTWALCYLIYLL